MTLREKQSLFVQLVGKLIEHAYELKYELTFGDAYATVGHMKGSLHGIRLAIDLNLFKDGKWMQTSEDHKPLGEYWESLHELCAWGGRFKDGNHYSLAHEGKK